MEIVHTKQTSYQLTHIQTQRSIFLYQSYYLDFICDKHKCRDVVSSLKISRSVFQLDGSGSKVLPLSASLCQLLILSLQPSCLGAPSLNYVLKGNAVVCSLLLFPKFCLLVSFVYWEVMTSSFLCFIYISPMDVFKLGCCLKASPLGDWK